MISELIGLPLMEPFVKKGHIFDWRVDTRKPPSVYALGEIKTFEEGKQAEAATKAAALKELEEEAQI